LRREGGPMVAPRHPLLRALHRLFASWRFPAFAISLLLTYKLLLLVVLLLPVDASALGRFAEEFKTWCFGYDPATGRMERMYVAMMLTEPVALASILSIVWFRELKELWRAPRQALPFASAALAVVAAGALSFGALAGTARADPQAALPFPCEQLRTAYEAPPLRLLDHEGNEATLEQHRGRVVLLTGVYATCGMTCPMILAQAKRALAALPEAQRREVTVLAVTLDPERDTPELMSQMAAAQGVSAPAFRLLSGEPGHVNAVLNRLDIARSRDPDTGIISHANLFLLVDRDGRIAFRFSLGERQEAWLIKALEHLLHDPRVG
ncbi:MAG: SCO family protein, partial [Myxococcales bacterium]